MALSRYANVPQPINPQPAQERIYRGDELTAGNSYTLISTRQTKKLAVGSDFLASKLVGEDGSRAVVSYGTGAVLYATANDIFSRWE